MNRRILIVDDNESLHDDFRKVLQRENSSLKNETEKMAEDLFGDKPNKPLATIDYDLDFASQGIDGLEKAMKAAADGKPYALIFMDVRMPPGIDGIEAIARIWKELPSTEMVICTAYSDHSFQDVTNRLGVSDKILCLKKPFDSVEVQQMAMSLTTKWNLNQDLLKYTSQLENKVQQTIKELEIERARAITSAKLVALGEMAGGVAHEINNPLAIIHGNANILKESLAGDFNIALGIKLTDKIILTAERIAKIITGLRVFSRDGNDDPFVAVTANFLLEETLALCREKFKVHNIPIHLEVSNPEGLIVCNQIQLVQVLVNLLNNTYDAIEPLSEKWIKIQINETQDGVDIILTDSGSGIPAHVREKMFQPFFTTKEIGKGTGLGLSISKGIIEAHHGKFWLDEKCKNTKFVIQLPKSQNNMKKVG